ncbi:hypothetical protein HRF87_02810 [Bacillus sp. CRN 9]|nr:hypothetical protein [Bacillus sp. CRN 9]
MGITMSYTSRKAIAFILPINKLERKPPLKMYIGYNINHLMYSITKV